MHEATVSRGAYPSPLNYHQFPKSVCTSVNEVICHGIPDFRWVCCHHGNLISIPIPISISMNSYALNNTAQSIMIWYDVIWYDMVCYDMIWCSRMWCHIVPHVNINTSTPMITSILINIITAELTKWLTNQLTGWLPAVASLCSQTATRRRYCECWCQCIL